MAIIPARAGSRGVPGKNVRELLAKPVISYTLEAALAASLVDRVVVSTDDAEVKEVSRGYDVALVDRPVGLAADAARIDEVMRHGCQEMERAFEYRADLVVLLYANIPVRGEGVIDRAIEKQMATGADSVQTLSPVGKFHPYWLYEVEGDRASVYVENQVYRRQMLPPLYYVDGAVGVVTMTSLAGAVGSEDPHAFWGRHRCGLVQEGHETVDIDTLRDFYLAEAALREKAAQGSVV